MSRIEVHTAGEWSALYFDGRLQTVGDSYHADEWIREHFGVVTVDDDAFMRGQGSRDGVAATLDQVAEYARERDARLARAAELRAEANRLLAEAEGLR
jgi:hypothetical protein